MTVPESASSSPQAPQADRRFSLALDHHKAGRHAEALALYDEILSEHPGQADVWINRGAVLRALERTPEAIASHRRGLELDPGHAGGWFNLGNALKGTRQPLAAAEAFGKAANLKPGDAHFVGVWAWSLLTIDRDDEAAALFARIVAAHPGNADAFHGLSACFRKKRQWPAAEAAARRAVALAPSSAPCRLQLGMVLLDRGKLLESEEMLLSALKLAPDDPSILAMAGQVKLSLQAWDEAGDYLGKAVALQYDHLDARLGIARMNLLRGYFPQAWDDYEWRWRRADLAKPVLPGAEWDGSPLGGRTILLHDEQGLGDSLQFVRYAPLVAAMGGRVILRCQAAAARLLATVPGISRVVTETMPLPDADVHATLLSLPRILRTTAETIPAGVPYLRAPPPRTPLPKRDGISLHAGIVWAGNPLHGNDHQRSCPGEMFLQLLRLPGLALYGLQKGPAPAASAVSPLLVPPLVPDHADMADTAAVIAQLDLVITVDTSVAHLAGALGKPVWLLLPYVPDWRWQTGRDTSPWYPTMRLFRQSRPGDWEGVFRAVEQALQQALAHRRSVRIPSVFKDADGRPRYHMTVPEAFLKDAGVGYLAQHETRYGGYEYCLRRFLDDHLGPGDLFIDVGAHWGIMSLQAATRWPELKVLAIEASSLNAGFLRRWLAENEVADRVEVIHAGAGKQEGQGSLRPESTMGHSVAVGPADGGRGIETVPMVTIDGLLAARPALAGRRIVMKVDVEGLEPEVVEGARGLIEAGRVAAIIWERGVVYDQAADRLRLEAMMAYLDGLGFRHWRFPHEGMGGPMIPYVFGQECGNVFSLAPGETPRPCYPKPPGAETAPPVMPQRSRLSPDARARFTRALMAAGGSDGGFWANPPHLRPGAEERARAAAARIAPGSHVLDIGAGLQLLRSILPPGCRYSPLDLIAWTADCVALDLNGGQYPDIACDSAALLAVLPYLHDPAGLLRHLRLRARQLLMTYPPSRGEPEDSRRGRGWFNDFSEMQLVDLLVDAGWAIAGRDDLGDEILLECRWNSE